MRGIVERVQSPQRIRPVLFFKVSPYRRGTAERVKYRHR